MSETSPMDKEAKKQQRRDDRALVPVIVAQILNLKVHVLAEAMRRNGLTEKLTTEQAKEWRDGVSERPQWLYDLIVDKTVRQAEQAHQAHLRAVQDRIQDLLDEEYVEQRLLAGKKIRGANREFIASDYAFRAMRDLQSVDGDISLLDPLSVAALKWAGIDAL